MNDGGGTKNYVFLGAKVLKSIKNGSFHRAFALLLYFFARSCSRSD
jgi:hypothetical protein